VRARGPHPTERRHDGEPPDARVAASVIVLRDGPAGPEVLLVQRNPRARFMGGAWVFPGGSVGAEDLGPASAGARELFEEAAISVPDAAELVPFSRWITPLEVAVRFDTHFFLVRAPAGAEGAPDGEECVDLRWPTPAGALAEHDRGELMLVFPTIKQLEQLARFAAVDDALAWAGAHEVEPVTPRIVGDGADARVLLPGEPGYEQEGDSRGG
jgi:8-oxo-dGTP pyrophosphatase MutT (NUDIX family)